MSCNTCGRRHWTTCRICGDQHIHARGLCWRCEYDARREGYYHEYAPLVRRGEDVAEDYDFLARQGYTRAQAAERMGMTKAALEKVLERRRERVA